MLEEMHKGPRRGHVSNMHSSDLKQLKGLAESTNRPFEGRKMVLHPQSPELLALIYNYFSMQMYFLF